MTSIRSAAFVLLACICASASARRDPATLPGLLLDELRHSAGVTGMSAAISRGGKAVWHGESGFADLAARAPVTAKTEFRLGSVSKFVTVAMLARLVDQRKIDLDRPVQAYLPDYPATQHAFSSLQLATHTAGIPHYDPALDADIDGAVAPYESVRDSLVLFQARPLLHAPGTRYHYSSFGYNLLSAVMEQAAQRDFLSLLADTARRAGTPSLQPERLGPAGQHWSKLYDPAGKEIPRRNISYKWAGGGMLSNATDLARLGARVLDPAFITPGTFARFTTPARLADGSVIAQDRFTMGLGWRLSSDHAGRRYVHHAGAIPGGRAQLSVYPQEGAAVALLSNVQAVMAMEPTSEALYDAYASPTTNGVCREGTRRYAGSFDGKTIDGTATTMRQGRFCRTVLSADNDFGKRVAPGRGDAKVVMLGRSSEGPAYFVTPVGIFTGSAAKDGLSALVVSRPLQLRLE